MHFRMDQREKYREGTLLHDNEDCMSNHKNYLSSVKKVKYVNVHYFFEINKIKHSDAKMVHFPIEKIIVDYSSKLEHGDLFVRR